MDDISPDAGAVREVVRREMIIETVMIVINVILGLIVAYENALFYKRTHMKNSWHWIKILYAAIGLYWAGLYSYRMFFNTPANIAQWHYLYVRPAITITLAAIAASAIMRMKAHKE